MKNMTNKIFYTEQDLDALGLLSRATRWRLRQTGDFPNPVKLSACRVGYPAKSIEDWISKRINPSLYEAN